MQSKKIGLVMFFMFLFSLTSCRSSRQESQRVEIKTSSTTEKIEKYRDTTLFAPKSETQFKLPIIGLTEFKPGLNDFQKHKVYSQKNGNATAKIEITHDSIYVFATCDSLAIVAKIKTELLKEKEVEDSKSNSEKNIKTGYTIFDLLTALAVGVGIGYLLKYLKKV